MLLRIPEEGLIRTIYTECKVVNTFFGLVRFSKREISMQHEHSEIASFTSHSPPVVLRSRPDSVFNQICGSGIAKSSNKRFALTALYSMLRYTL